MGPRAGDGSDPVKAGVRRPAARTACIAGLGIAMLALGGCAGYGNVGYGYGDVGYGYGDAAYGYGDVDPGYPGDDLGYGLDFFEPFGYGYGAWGGGYLVGPWAGGYGRGGAGQHPSFRPAAPSRPMPSIPMRPRFRPMGRAPR